ncbi:carboxymuconolactone decarboxylase family protein [Dactylosporangium sp. CA-152071]|uniref:carboxymuconolactone decarboxylase family protein n=1 Tax=Dactylosporangium sp. CA-152071 TaxID=3239933 RepID=UPI003D90CC48
MIGGTRTPTPPILWRSSGWLRAACHHRNRRERLVVVSRVASSVVQRQIRYVAPVPLPDATGLVREVYAQIADEMLLVVPPAQLHSPSPDVLAAYWMLSREPLAGTAVGRAAKEAVAAAVAVANICPYCVEMHTVGMYDLSGEHEAEAVAGDRVESMIDPALRAMTAWARTAHQLDDAAPEPPGLAAAERAELLGVVVGFHYVSRVVNVFLSNFLLPPGLGPRSRRRMKQGISRLLRPMLRTPRAGGRSVGLLPAAPIPVDMTWSAGNEDIAAAVARSCRTFELAGARSVPAGVRRLVLDRLEAWRGEDTGLSTTWCEDLIADLPAHERAAGRLALLTAVSSYQVGEGVISEFRRFDPSDAGLVDTVAWSAFAAARLIGNRLAAARADAPPVVSDFAEVEDPEWRMSGWQRHRRAA